MELGSTGLKVRLDANENVSAAQEHYIIINCNLCACFSMILLDFRNYEIKSVYVWSQMQNQSWEGNLNFIYCT